MTLQTHQQFMDDTMLMGVSLIREEREIIGMLDTFKKASRL